MGGARAPSGAIRAQSGPGLARWLVGRRRAIEARLAERMGSAAPHGGAAEAELLRRFRSYLLAALQGGAPAAPPLEGLRVDAVEAARWVDAWLAAAAEEAGEDAGALRARLAPLAERFALALRGTGSARRRSGPPRPSKRRAVSAAIDRVAEAFLAIDTETGRIADANPAAGALLGTSRDHLLEADALGFVPDAAREHWWSELDALAEGSEPRRFAGALRDAAGRSIPVEASLTRFATRKRTLALLVARAR